MVPQKVLKIRYPRFAKIDMKNARKLNHAAKKVVQKTHHASSLFHEYMPEK